MATPPETCEACRFDGGQYGLQDTLGTLRALAPVWSQVIEGIDDRTLLARPAPEVWSAAEYAAHSADVVEAMGRLVHAALTVPDPVVPDLGVPPEPPVADGIRAAVERLGQNADRLHATVRSIGAARAAGWRRTVTIGDSPADVAWLIRHAVHDGTHHLADVGRGLHQLGAGAPTQEGTVAALHVSDGGVPKLPIEAAEVGDRGLVGDRQATRQHHGKPMQALCLWSSEVIAALQSEGHPVAPGLAGENITVTGVDWSTIRPGVQLLVGDVLAEISAYAVPCKKNAPWFTDGDFNRMSQDRHPGWSRAYAWVREPGTIRTGDPVVVEP